MSTRVRSLQQGFTLIEVAVAFAIFALSIGAFYEIFSGAMRRSAQARERELALLQAQSLLSQLRARPAPWESHESGASPAGLIWQIDAIPFYAGTEERSPWRAYDVTVRVRKHASMERGIVLKSIELATESP